MRCTHIYIRAHSRRTRPIYEVHICDVHIYIYALILGAPDLYMRYIYAMYTYIYNTYLNHMGVPSSLVPRMSADVTVLGMCTQCTHISHTQKYTYT